MAVNKLDITMMEDVGTSANQLLQRDGSGNIPALDGSQLTGVTEFTTSTSDPAIDTNPAGGVGSLWYNKTGGEMYCCTDATAGANLTAIVLATEVGQFIGTYSAAADTFTSDTVGSDLMLIFVNDDSTTGDEAIILVGQTNIMADSEIANGIITVA